MLRPVHLLRTLFLVPVLALALLLPGGAEPAEAAGFDCISILSAVQSYCRSHEQAGDDTFDLICRSHALIAFCNCHGVQCVEEED